MFILATVTKWSSIRDGGGRVTSIDRPQGRVFLLNPQRIENLRPNGLGSRFLWHDNPQDPREGASYIEADISLSEIEDAINTSPSSEFLTLPFYVDNKITKGTINRSIPIEDISFVDECNYSNPASWVIYLEDGFKKKKELCSYSLADIGFLVGVYSLKYGLLYNWYVTSDLRLVSGDEWHVPTEDNIDALLIQTGGSSLAGGELKETGLTYWNDPNTGASDSVGFKARGSGMADATLETFRLLKSQGSIFISDEINESIATVDAVEATDIYTTTFTANWLARSSEIIGFHVDVSTDVNFGSFVLGYNDLDVGYVFSLDAVGLNQNTTYCYRIRGITATSQTENSNVISAITYTALDLSSFGTGTGVLQFNINLTSLTTLELTGVAKFYDDVAGTINPQSLITINGLNTLYLKCPSGSESLIISDPSTFTEFEVTSTLSDYPNIPVFSGNIMAFYNLVKLVLSLRQRNTFTITASGISRHITDLVFYGTDMTGNLSELPDTLQIFVLDFNHLTGNIADLPVGLTQFYCYRAWTISGSLSDTSSNLQHFFLYTNGNISGNFSGLKEGLKTFVCTGTANTFEGDLTDLPSTLEVLLIYSSHSITGSLANAPIALTTFFINSGNIVSGNISDLNANMTMFGIASSNTISGSLSDLPALMTYFSLTGLGSISGNVSDLPNVMTYFNVYAPTGIIHGALTDLSANITIFSVSSDNDISGNVSDIPAQMTNIALTGHNVISGDLADIPANIVAFFIDGNNTIGGDLADVPISVTYFLLDGNNVVTAYTSGKTFSDYMNYFVMNGSGGTGLSSAEVDSLLIDLDSSDWLVAPKVLTIMGTNGARTPASNVAVLSLQAKGVTVNTN